jgi:hypothetical protein
MGTRSTHGESQTGRGDRQIFGCRSSSKQEIRHLSSVLKEKEKAATRRLEDQLCKGPVPPVGLACRQLSGKPALSQGS